MRHLRCPVRGGQEGCGVNIVEARVGSRLLDYAEMAGCIYAGDPLGD